MPSNDDIEFLVDSADIANLDDASDINDELDEVEEEDDGLDDLADEYAAEEERDLVSESLSPGRPLLMVHRGHQMENALIAALNNISERHAGAIGLGVIASMPRMSPAKLQSFLTRADLPPVRIADPEGFARLDSFGSVLASQRDGKEFVGPSRSKYWNYLTEPQPPGATEEWVKDVVDSQRDAGATVLLTPGLWADPSAPTRSIETMRRHAEWARQHVGDYVHLAVNLTLPSNWLIASHLRDRLLNEIIDMDEVVFYVRVRWPLLPQPYGQLLDTELLDGYAEVSNVFEDNDKILLLPNTGLTGMIALAWGAHGFSTGLGSGERAFADTRVIKIKQSPRPTPAERIFAPSIMHVVERSTSAMLDALPGGSQCGCIFCRRMRKLPTGFSRGLAGAHYLRNVSDLTAKIAAGTRGTRAATRALVRQASQFADTASNSGVFDGKNDPRHLRLWAERLR